MPVNYAFLLSKKTLYRSFCIGIVFAASLYIFDFNKDKRCLFCHTDRYLTVQKEAKVLHHHVFSGSNNSTTPDSNSSKSSINSNTPNHNGSKSSNNSKASNWVMEVKAADTFKIRGAKHTPLARNGLNWNYPELKYHIGVLSSAKYLETRAVAVYHTWGAEAKSVVFYVGNINYTGNLPVIQMSAVNDSVYPPQEKSFSMLKYWCQNLLQESQWFIKVDDDTYVKVERLERFLRSLDETKKYYLGRYGRGLPFERTQLGLYDNFFCTGPTVIYSKPLLEEICPYIDTCMKEVVTPHEDTEIGRCVISKAGLQCGQNDIKKSKVPVTVNKLFYQSTIKDKFSGNLDSNKDIKGAITLHELKQPLFLYNVHYHTNMWRLKDNPVDIQHKSNPLAVYQSPAKGYEQMCKTSFCPKR